MSVKTKKVGIVTLHGYSNYGNRLQNYALQEVIKGLGCEIETLVLKNNFQKEKGVHKAKRMLNLSLKEIRGRTLQRFRNLQLKITNYKKKGLIKDRESLFIKFCEEFLIERVVDVSKQSLEDVSKDYDYLITGSDQVWNLMNDNMVRFYFLAFAEPRKRVSYAASFGVDFLPNYYKVKIKPHLAELKSISVRENAAVQIVKELTGRDAVVSMDPTLLIPKQNWLYIAKMNKNPGRNYLLVYFLGQKSKEAKIMIERISENFDLEKVQINDLNDQQFFTTSPQEFIGLFNSAEIVLTDSFHGVVFSILFKKPFIVFKRVGGISMYSRIKNLLGMLNLEEREAHNQGNLSNLFDLDYSQVDSILQERRKKDFDFLRESLKINKISF